MNSRKSKSELCFTELRNAPDWQHNYLEMETDDGNINCGADGKKEGKKDCFHLNGMISMNTNSNGSFDNSDNNTDKRGDGCLNNDQCAPNEILPGEAKGKLYKKMKTSKPVISKASLKKIKAMCMGTIPLKPLGLSLSGSGMELYVKIDPSKQKGLQYQDRKMKCAKNIKATSKKRVKRIAATTQTANIPSPIRKILKKGNANAKLKRTSLEMTTSAHDIQTNNISKTEGQNCSQAIIIKDEISDELFDNSNPEMFVCGQRQIMEDSNTCTVDANAHDPSGSYITRPPMDHCRNERPTAPCNMTESDQQADSTFEDSKHRMLKKRKPIVFTSNDLPLKRFQFQKMEGKKRVNLNNHRLAKRPESDSETSTNHFVTTSSSHGPSTGAEVLSSVSLQLRKNRQPFKTGDGDDNLRRDSTYVASEEQEERKNGRSPGRVLQTPEAENNNANASPKSMSVAAFDIPDRGMDEAAVTKFIEYTTLMRKDLKKSHKRLSDLIKEFNEDVVEHYKTEDAVPDKQESCTANRSRMSCSIM